MKSVLLAGFGLVAGALGQTSVSPATGNVVLAVALFHNECDRTSLIDDTGVSDGGNFDASGATMCYDSGEYFYERYFRNDSELLIYGASEIYNQIYVTAEVPILTPLDFQSATAFMQGVFQPVDDAQSVVDPDDIPAVDNSTFSGGPLGGYQYPVVMTYAPTDPNIVYVLGSYNCPTQQDSQLNYINTTDFVNMVNLSQPLYDALYPLYFAGVFQQEDMSYLNSYQIYDYAAQNQKSNKTLQGITDQQLEELRYYASVYSYNWYANDSTALSTTWQTDPNVANNMKSIGGRTYAQKALNSLNEAMASGGNQNKFSVVVSSYDIMMSFFAISNLTAKSSNFSTLPNLGASMVFELYTTDVSVDSDGSVDSNSLYVVFGFRNSTDDVITYWPLFDEDETYELTWTDFQNKMGAAGVYQPSDWCSLCQIDSNFCDVVEGYNNPSSPSSTASADNSSSKSKQMSPAVAGVIGAIIMLAITGIAAGIAFLVFGVGIYRDRRRSSVISGLGRTAPKEKVGSDIELPLSPTAAPMPRAFDDDEVEEERQYNTVSSTRTAVASPVASPDEAHFKAWESRL